MLREMRYRRQRLAGHPRAGKNRGRAVALMDVAIDRHRGANLVVALHAADGDGHVVDHAEAFAVIGERVMKSSADADGHAVVEGLVGGQHGTARRQPEGAHQLRRVRHFELQLFERAERARLQFLDVLRSVHEQHVLIGSRTRSDKIGRLGNSGWRAAGHECACIFRREKHGSRWAGSNRRCKRA